MAVNLSKQCRACRGVQVYYKYRVLYRHPRTGVAGLSIMYTEDEIAGETARLESLGYVVSKILRPVGALPEVPPTSWAGSPPP